MNKEHYYSTVGTVTFPVYLPPRPTFDDVIDIYCSLHRPVEAEWLIGRATWAHLLKLKDGNGRYIHTDVLDMDIYGQWLCGYPVRITDDEPDALRLVMPGDDAATGATERLHTLCNQCDTEMPPGAAYCIKCGKAVN